MQGFAIPLGTIGDLLEKPRRTPGSIDPEAQRMELEARFKAYHEPRVEFAGGQFVEFKPGLSLLMQPGIQVMFWRYTDISQPYDLEVLRATLDKRGVENWFDCVVAILDAEGKDTLFCLMDSQCLKPARSIAELRAAEKNEPANEALAAE